MHKSLVTYVVVGLVCGKCCGCDWINCRLETSGKTSYKISVWISSSSSSKSNHIILTLYYSAIWYTWNIEVRKSKRKKQEKWRLQQRVWYWKIKIDENRKKIFQQHSLAHGARYSTILQQFSITTFQQSFIEEWLFIAICNAVQCNLLKQTV